MQVTCPNAGCNEAYTIGPEHVGRRSTCKGCGATFTIEADGLQLVDAPAAAAPLADPPPAKKKRTRVGRGMPSPVSEAMGPLKQDPFTWLMLAGTVIVIFFLFQPVLDNLKASRINAQIQELRQEKDADKDDLEELQEDLQDAQLSARKSGYFYTWFMLIGFLLLAVAEIGYLITGASKAKRVTGAVLLCGQLLMVFISYMGASVAAMF